MALLAMRTAKSWPPPFAWLAARASASGLGWASLVGGRQVAMAPKHEEWQLACAAGVHSRGSGNVTSLPLPSGLLASAQPRACCCPLCLLSKQGSACLLPITQHRSTSLTPCFPSLPIKALPVGSLRAAGSCPPSPPPKQARCLLVRLCTFHA